MTLFILGLFLLILCVNLLILVVTISDSPNYGHPPNPREEAADSDGVFLLSWL